MSTKVILGIIAAIVVVGGGAWYLTSNPTAPTDETGIENTGAENEGSGASTFAALAARMGSWRCTVETFVEEAPSQGEVFISNGKIRGDFTSQPAAMNGQSVVSHMIHVDGYVYTWSDMYPQGMKMRIPEGDASASSNTGGVPGDAQVTYDCNPWTVDASVFAPPAGITFMELGGNGMPGAMPSYPVPN